MTTEERDYLIDRLGCKLQKYVPFHDEDGEECDVLTLNGVIIANPEVISFEESANRIKEFVLKKII